MKKIYDVTFVYAGSRKEKLKTIDKSASDFFYGFLELKKNDINTTFLEIPDKKTGVIDKLIIITIINNVFLNYYFYLGQSYH